jgi:Rrf2 family protein
MCELAKRGAGERDTVRRTADAASVPYDYARTIARDLVSARLLSSRRGVGGGVVLARPAEEISILDIMRAMDDEASLSLCTKDPSICDRNVACPIHVGVWRGLDVLIEGYLAQHTLADAVALGAQLEASLAREPELAL